MSGCQYNFCVFFRRKKSYKSYFVDASESESANLGFINLTEDSDKGLIKFSFSMNKQFP